MWTTDVEDYTKPVLPGRSVFAAFRSLHDALQPTPLYRGGLWLAACLVLAFAALGKRRTPEGAFVIGACGSAALYVSTFFLVGVAPDFRFVYWAVLAALAGIAVLPTRRAAT
jgi:hypothetical protein